MRAFVPIGIVAVLAAIALWFVIGVTRAGGPTREAAPPSTSSTSTPTASPTPTHEAARHAGFAQHAPAPRPTLSQYQLMAQGQGASLGQVEFAMGGEGTRTAASTGPDSSILETYTWSGTNPAPWSVSADFRDGAMTAATESGLS